MSTIDDRRSPLFALSLFCFRSWSNWCNILLRGGAISTLLRVLQKGISDITLSWRKRWFGKLHCSWLCVANANVRGRFTAWILQ